MKNNLLLTFCLASFSLLAQRSPRADSVGVMAAIPNQGNQTRALVIGISKYQDSVGITNLQFANRDAQVFADYLKSPAGGGLPAENVWLMTDKTATLGAIDNALNWLIKETRKGDKVIIYFSGHGDVENQTLWQRGFLLAYATPAHLYRNNAVRVEDLDEIIKTLSIRNEAKVIVILDACRAGNLANAGPSLTAEQLQKQAENEVRILSCKPDQKSLEGELWGGGRGMFSYYLVNGLKGLANLGSFLDNTVSFNELEDFVKKNMATSINDNNLTERQNPVFIGDENFELAEVNADALNEASRDMGIAMTSPHVGLGDKGVSAKSPDGKISTSKDDALIQFIQLANLDGLAEDPDFAIAVAANAPDILMNFFTHKLSVAETQNHLDPAAQALFPTFSQAIKKAKKDENLRQHLQELLAARLHDQTQDVINAYLRGDAKELDKRHYIDQVEKYIKYPLMLQAAMQLLPKDHLLYHEVAVKYHYFDGVCTRLASQMSDIPLSRIPAALEKQKLALALDDKAAYIHNELGILYWVLGDNKLAREHFETAVELAPSWALPLVNLCNYYRQNGELDKAQTLGEKAELLQPNYYAAYLALGQIAEQKQDLLKAETLYRKARSLNEMHYIPFEKRAYLMLKTGRFEEANAEFKKMDDRKIGFVPRIIMDSDGDGVVDFLDFDPNSPGPPEPGILVKNPKTAEDYFLNGKYYFEQNQFEAAELNFKKTMRLEPNHLEVYSYLGKICHQQKRYGEAEIYYKRLINLNPEKKYMQFSLADVYRDWGRPKEEEAIYHELIESDSNAIVSSHAYHSLHQLLDKQGRYEEEELLLWEYSKVDKNDALKLLGMFYNKMTTLYPKDANWLYRYVDFIAKYSIADEAESIQQYLKVTELDTLFPARAYIYEKAGDYYFSEGKNAELTESEEGWEGAIPLAIENYRKAISLVPRQPEPKYNLVKAHLTIFQYEEAMAALKSLQDSAALDFDSQLTLADLLLRSGQFAKAQALLDKALDIQPEAIKRLPALSGLAQMLQGNAAESIKFYQQEIALHPKEENANWYYTLAELYALQAQKAEALKWLKEAFERGFKSKLVVKYDPALEGLRKDAKYEELLVEYSMK